jgi:signal transduction histidine kinase
VTDGVAYVAIIYLGHRAHVAEGKLGEANAALRAADTAKDDFLAQLAHELRNSFLVMMNVVGLLRRAPADKETLDTLDRQVHAASRIADDLLDAERIRRGDIALHPSRTDLRSLVREALARARPAIDAAHQSATMVLSPDPITAYVDPDRCLQMLTNLLDNAVKYAGAGANIEVAATVAGGRNVLSVRDNGVGLKSRGSKGSSKAGFGIGLPLCEKLARMQGAELVVDSAPDRPGFAVTIRFQQA